MVHFKMACYMVIGLIMLAAGCAPSAAKKTDTAASASAGSTPKASTSPSPGEGKRDTARESTTDRSSLGRTARGKVFREHRPAKRYFIRL